MHRLRDHGRVEMARRAGVHLDRGSPRAPDEIRIDRGLLIALHDAQRKLAAKVLERANEERGLARARARHQIERHRRRLPQRRPVLGRQLVVLPEQIELELHDARLRLSRPHHVVMVVSHHRPIRHHMLVLPLRMPAPVPVLMLVLVLVLVRVPVLVRVRVPVLRLLRRPTTPASRAHLSSLPAP